MKEERDHIIFLNIEWKVISVKHLFCGSTAPGRRGKLDGEVE